MVVIEIPPNSNCEPVDLRLFHDVDAARPVQHVCLERDGGPSTWYEVTGWTAAGAPCPAVAQRVDDSGEGLAVLIYGGDAGLRLRPRGSSEPWGAQDGQEWGMPFLLMADDGRSVVYQEGHHG